MPKTKNSRRSKLTAVFIGKAEFWPLLAGLFQQTLFTGCATTSATQLSHIDKSFARPLLLTQEENGT